MGEIMYNILVLNAGSSSLKFKLFSYETESIKTITSGQFTKTNANNPTFSISINNQKISKEFNNKLSAKELLGILNDELTSNFKEIRINAIGHRVVHGGDLYIEPTLIDDNVINNLKTIIYLTPIHLPHNIVPMEICREIFKSVPQVACFDTAFHSTIPTLQRTYAIPRELTEKEKIKRYGFHGLSYEYLISKLEEHNKYLANGKVIIAHLGAGASICALKNKFSVDTTMGLTPLEGLIMGTRSGSIDPSIVLYLMQKGFDYKAITDILYFKSGLLGVSELTPDFATISMSNNEKAQEAYSLFVNSITKHILSLSSTLQGIEALVFSGGIGENSSKLRYDVLNKLSWLGLSIDEEANKNNSFTITTLDSKIPSFVIPTEEELVISKQVYNLVK